MMHIDAPLLVAALRCTQALAERFAAPLTDACRMYAIDTPARLAAFLAQIGHESGALRHTVEIWGPTDAQKRYEGRADLGNLQPGDGFRFRGRALIQTTGRANYRTLTQRLRQRGVDCPDFEVDPDELQAPWWAALSAADYWDMRGLNALADAGDFAQITRRINGGLNGQADRLARWDVAKAALAAHVAEPNQVAQAPQTAPKEASMPIPAIVGALLPVLTSAVPELVKIIKPGSESAAQNAALAAKAFEVAQAALGATNAQDVAERVQADPAAAQTVREAVQQQWYSIAEAGGGGIAGAREADAAAAASGVSIWHSRAFWALVALLPLAYLIVGSIVGLWGGVDWPSDVRAAIATAVISLIVGGAAGYYWGGTTTANAKAK